MRNEAELAKAFVDSNQLVEYLNDNWPDGPSDSDFEKDFLDLVELSDEETPPAGNATDNKSYAPGGGDPVYMSNGEYAYSATDLSVAGRVLSVQITRTYGSRREYNSRFGYGWDMNYNMKARKIASIYGEPNEIVFLDGEGAKREYIQSAVEPNYYYRENSFADYLHDINGVIVLVRKSGTEYQFDNNGNLSSITDKNGNSVTFAYDGNGLMDLYGPSAFFESDPCGKYDLVAKEYQLTAITDDLGRQINLAYDSNGLLSTITDFTGRTWTYTYNPYTNDLISVEDPNGLITEYSYDPAHNLKTVTDPNEQTYTINYYDIFNDKVGYQTYGYGDYIFDYNELTNTALITDREGYIAKMVYNDFGVVLSKTIYTKDANDEPNSFTTSYQYEPNTLEMTWQFLPDGSCIYYTYDDLANLTGIYRKTGPNEPNVASGPNVIATTYTYDDTHIYDINSITDPMGNITSFEYDVNGNVKKITYPSVPVYGQGDQTPTIEYAYNAFGQVETVTSPDGIVTKYVYYDDDDVNDPNCGKLWKVIVDANENDPCRLEISTEYAYDAYGNVRLVIDPNGDYTTFQYNELNLLTQTVSPLDYVTKYKYNKNKKLQQITREITDEPNQITSYTYDILDHLKTVTDPCSNITAYGYNKSEEPNIVIDAEDNNTVSIYNERGLLTAVIDANGNTTHYTYTANGSINDINDAKGNVTSYTYDGFGRLKMITYPDDSNEQFTYDKNSNILTKTNRKGETIEYEYDAMNRLKVKNREDDPNICFAYDIAGRIAEVNDLRGNSQGGGVTSFYYDRIGRVEDIQDIEGRWVSYEYDSRGLRTKLVYTDDSNVTYEYDAMSRLRKVKYDSSIIAEYDYDELSRRKLLTFGNDANAVYEYDIADRLRKLTNNVNDVNITFTYADYDKVGNRLSMQINDTNAHIYGYDNLYQLIFVDYNNGFWTNFLYDALGNREEVNDTGSTIVYDTNNLNQYSAVGPQGSQTDYHYDKNGNLSDDGTYLYYYDIENRLLDVNDQGDNPVASYEYDYQGRRVRKTDNTLNPVRSTLYVYDGDQVIAECNESGTLLRKFIYGPGIDEPICMVDVADSNKVYYYHFDGLGSVVALSDSNAEIVEQYSYDVFGEPDITSSINNPYMFTGRHYDSETGLYYYRARYYDFTNGRFISPDPIGYDDGMNLYRYVGNNPLIFVDPLGLCKQSDTDKARRLEEIQQYQEYIKYAEATMVSNIETLNLLHGKIAGYHEYYWWLLVGNTTVSAASVVNTAYTFSQVAAKADVAVKLTTEIPFRNGWVIADDLLRESASIATTAKRSAALDVIGTSISFVNYINIDDARKRAISKYDPFVEQTLLNIEALSKGVSTARQEIRRLSNEQ